MAQGLIIFDPDRIGPLYRGNHSIANVYGRRRPLVRAPSVGTGEIGLLDPMFGAVGVASAYPAILWGLAHQFRTQGFVGR